MKNEQQLFIGKLAQLSGVKPDTIRFYERSGLLPKPPRSNSSYRLYDSAAVAAVRFIRKAQSLGFSLAEIKRILSMRGRGAERCRCVIAMAEATLSETEKKITELRRFADSLRQNLARWRTTPLRSRNLAREFCSLIESSRAADPPN